MRNAARCIGALALSISLVGGAARGQSQRQPPVGRGESTCYASSALDDGPFPNRSAFRYEARPQPGIVVTHSSYLPETHHYVILHNDSRGVLSVEYNVDPGRKRVRGMLLSYHAGNAEALHGHLRLDFRENGEYGVGIDVAHPDMKRYGSMDVSLDSSVRGGDVLKRLLPLDAFAKRAANEVESLRTWDGCAPLPLDPNPYHDLFKDMRSAFEPMLCRYKDNAKGAMQESLRRAKDALKKLLPDSRRP